MTGRPPAFVDGLPASRGTLAKLRRRGQRLAVSRAQQDEAQIEQRLLSHPGVTRPNIIALISPAGGVGKTACALMIADLLAARLKLRTVVIESGARRPGARGGVGALLSRGAHTAAELSSHVERLAGGAHLLTAHAIDPDRYGELVVLASTFYEVVLLDPGTGVVGPLATRAARRADQIVLVTTADRVTATAAARALEHLDRPERTTMVVNKVVIPDAIAIPHDEQLAGMLEDGTYSLAALRTDTRTAIKRLGLAVAERLV